MFKMLRYTLTLATVALLSSIPIIAQGQYSTSADSDPEATLLLDKMEAFLNSMPRLHVTYDFVMSFPGEDPIKYTGTLDQEGMKYIIDFNDYLIKCDGNLRWVYMESENEVNIYNAEDGNELTTPLEYLQLYRSEDFVYRVVEQGENSNNRSIEFKPLDKNSDFIKVRLTLVESDGQPTRVEVFEKGGSSSDLKINSISGVDNYPKGFFIFNPKLHSGIHIEDLRID